jgi:uncharacterized membrane protein
MGDQASVTSGLFLFIAAFLATGVEMVEAMTIILATGITRGWRSTFVGTGAAAIILAAIVAVFGLALKDIPLAPLRIVVGTFLLIFGLQWLRKAILRWGGVLAYHDEDRIFAREVQALRGEAVASTGIDWQAFVVAFKGVLLEGLEAVFIVVTFGLSAGDRTLAGFSGVGLAAVGGGAALIVVVAAAVVARKPLSSIPENTMKAAVGLLLGAFGTFWAGEGVGIEWPLGEASILLLLAFYTLLVWALTARVRALQAVSRSAQGVPAR